MLRRLIDAIARKPRAPTEPLRPGAMPGPAEEAERRRLAGNALLAQGHPAAAADAYRQATALQPDSATLHVNLGYALMEAGEMQGAQAALERASALAADNFDAPFLLGQMAMDQGRWSQAVEPLRRALALAPDDEATRLSLCRALQLQGRLGEAASVVDEGLVRRDDVAALHAYRGNLHVLGAERGLALASYARSLSIAPDDASVHNSLALTLEKFGRTDEAVAHFRRAVELAPQFGEAHRNLLFALSYASQPARSGYLAEARRYGATLMAQARPLADGPAARGHGAKPLRVGFVSPDFRAHPVGYFLQSILQAWDPADVELWAYSCDARSDAMTQALSGAFQHWRSIAGVNDAQAAQQVRDDGIHILVDLAGHTDGGRLPLFAWRPAPVQVSWLGYFASTGLEAIDYFIADAISAPPSVQTQFSEQIWLLPRTRLCFTPPHEPEAHSAPGDPPCLANGFTTFGCFQAITKINDGVLAAWSSIMAARPNARLRLQGGGFEDASLRADFERRCVAAGMDLARMTILPPTPRAAYLEAHREIDLILDTFPYPGGTTTCEALWMGVPSLTIAGETLLARQGASMLSCVELDDWVASGVDDYVARAVRFADQQQTLRSLRHSLRDTLRASELTDAERFAKELRSAFSRMWERHGSAAG